MTPSTKTPKSTPGSRRIRAGNLDPAAFSPFGQVIQNPAIHGSPALEKVVANQGSATKWLDVTRMRSWYELAASKKSAGVSMNMFVCKPRESRKVGVGEGEVFDVRVLERHPYTPQTFVPMGLGKADHQTYYLVIVAPTLPSRSWSEEEKRRAPYPIERPVVGRKTLRERLLGARPNPFTNDYSSSTTPPSDQTSDPQPKGTGPPDLDNIQAFIARGDQAVTYGPGTWHAPMVVLGEKPIEFVVVQYANGVAVEDCQEYEIGDGEVAVDLSDDGDEGTAIKARL